jgi:NAD(P)-dependent dehydrogenase (short-subunit alcohol dehydrogenase family)
MSAPAVMPRPFVLITGASRGIGAATAWACARMGWDVGLNYLRSSDAAQALAKQVQALGVRCELLRADMANEAQIKAAFASLDAQGIRVTGLVNNAGIVQPQSRLDAMTQDRLQLVLHTNVIGPMLVAREAVRRMSTRHGGSGGAIVNVSSMAAVLGSPGQYVDYAASKGAIDTFTVGLARELAQEGIRVNGVRPGIIDTDIHASGGEPDRARASAPLIPMRRPGSADEVAQAIVWLLSPAASYATGTLIDVSGGR